MSFWTAVVIIVAIGGIVSVLQARYRAQNGITQDMMGNQILAKPEEDETSQSEVEELRERVKVLERIATDANSTDSRKVKQISDEIEKLRDS